LCKGGQSGTQQAFITTFQLYPVDLSSTIASYSYLSIIREWYHGLIPNGLSVTILYSNIHSFIQFFFFQVPWIQLANQPSDVEHVRIHKYIHKNNELTKKHIHA
jgi:hypothetical protein